MRVEFLMSEKFRDYAIKNCTKEIKAHKIITELLKNKGISKPKDLKVEFCSIADLKYKGRKIVEASMSIISGKIFLNVI